MSEQFIITLSREYGSGGHEVARQLAKRLGVAMYDRDIIKHISEMLGVDPEKLRPYEERPKNHLLSRRVKGHSNSAEEILAEMQFDFIKMKAESGESFVVVGRCADSFLEGRRGLVKVFVSGYYDQKLARVMERSGLDEIRAAEKMKKIDRARKWFHNRYSDFKWGDLRHYDISVNSSIGIDETASLLETYIRINLRWQFSEK